MVITAQIDESELKRIIDGHLTKQGYTVLSIKMIVMESNKGQEIKCDVELSGKKDPTLCSAPVYREPIAPDDITAVMREAHREIR